jgi:predicted dehydrogenase
MHASHTHVPGRVTPRVEAGPPPAVDADAAPGAAAAGDGITRRGWLGTGAAGARAAAGGSPARGAEPQPAARAATPVERIHVAVMGVNGRGAALAKVFNADPRAEVVKLCEVDERIGGALAESLGKDGRRRPALERDIRRVLDDKQVDVLVIAAPNHWHAPATIMAAAAGKHVYVEKPCSHTPEEGELAVAAARRHGRVVTMGSQRRSWPAVRAGIERLRAGDLGEVRYARTFYAAKRGTIGRKPPTPPPAWLDWELWQGPAPERPFQENFVHYNWHWRWHWGNGELGNNGVHAIDVARWGLGVTYPTRVTAGGGRYHFDDDQETPDTMMTTFEFPEQRLITWEGLSCTPSSLDASDFGIWFVGEKGSMIVGKDGGYSILDPGNVVVETKTGTAGEATHIADFLDCIATGGRPHADIEEAHRSTLLCHLGNIAYRTGRSLVTRPADGRIAGDAEAEGLWSREYRAGWRPSVT